MLASRFLRHHEAKEESALGQLFERGFSAMQRGYGRTLDMALAHRPVVLLFAFGTFVLTGLLFYTIPKGFFPEEDIGQIQVTTEASEDISFVAMEALNNRVGEILRKDPAVAAVGTAVGGGGFNTATLNTGRSRCWASPWRWGWWSTTPSSCWKTSFATSRTAWRRSRRRSRAREMAFTTARQTRPQTRIFRHGSTDTASDTDPQTRILKHGSSNTDPQTRPQTPILRHDHSDTAPQT